MSADHSDTIEKPSWAEFAAPFCAGWNAHKDHGELGPDEFVKVLNEAYDRSGPMLAYKVLTGAMSEADARGQIDARLSAALGEEVT